MSHHWLASAIFLDTICEPDVLDPKDYSELARQILGAF
jgi:hypothetical protein